MPFEGGCEPVAFSSFLMACAPQYATGVPDFFFVPAGLNSIWRKSETTALEGRASHKFVRRDARDLQRHNTPLEVF